MFFKVILQSSTAYSCNLTPNPKFEIPEEKKQSPQETNEIDYIQNSIPHFSSGASNTLS